MACNCPKGSGPACCLERVHAAAHQAALDKYGIRSSDVALVAGKNGPGRKSTLALDLLKVVDSLQDPAEYQSPEYLRNVILALTAALRKEFVAP